MIGKGKEKGKERQSTRDMFGFKHVPAVQEVHGVAIKTRYLLLIYIQHIVIPPTDSPEKHMPLKLRNGIHPEANHLSVKFAR